MTDDAFATVSFDTASMRINQRFFTERFLKAAKESLASVGKSVERDLEAATEAAGLGRLSRAWNSRVYPKTGLAQAPSVSIYPKGKTRTLGAILAYSRGAEIKGKSGQWLAIPLPAAGPKRAGRNAAALTPREWERRTGLKLRLIPGRRGKNGLLVLDEAKVLKSGRARLETDRRRAAGKANTSVPIFVLVPRVTVRKRFDIAAVTRPAPGRLAADFIQRANAINASKG